MRSASFFVVVLALCSGLGFSALACGSSSQAGAPGDAGRDALGPGQDQLPNLDGGDGGDAAPVDNGSPSTTYPAPHPALPQVVNPMHGLVLETPKIYLIFFPGYLYEHQLITYAQTIGASSYWGPATKEYGVGAVQYAGSIELSGADATPPTTIADTAVEAFLNSRIAGGAFGTPDKDAIYTIVYPSTTTITSAGGPFGPASSCSSFGGYHSDTAVTLGDAGTATNFAFAVIPTCGTFDKLSGIDGVTGAASHEWVEACTDPFPSTNAGTDAAYAGVDANHVAWEVLGGGGETGDLCVSEVNAFYKPQDLAFTVQRTWSNALALAGHDPCGPNLPGVVFFESAPVLTENVSFSSQLLGGTIATQGVTIAVGASKVVEVDLFSDAPTSGAWTVNASDPVAELTGAAPTLLFAWDRTSGLNGEKLHLTITVKTASSLLGGAHPFVITSTLGQLSHEWAGFVVE